MSAKSLLRGPAPTQRGEILSEIVPPTIGKRKMEIARLLRESRQPLYEILSERQPVTPEMALRIGKLCGNGPEIWSSPQQAYDLEIAQRTVGAAVEKIPTLPAALLPAKFNTQS